MRFTTTVSVSEAVLGLSALSVALPAGMLTFRVPSARFAISNVNVWLSFRVRMFSMSPCVLLTPVAGSNVTGSPKSTVMGTLSTEAGDVAVVVMAGTGCVTSIWYS